MRPRRRRRPAPAERLPRASASAAAEQRRGHAGDLGGGRMDGGGKGGGGRERSHGGPDLAAAAGAQLTALAGSLSKEGEEQLRGKHLNGKTHENSVSQLVGCGTLLGRGAVLNGSRLGGQFPPLLF